VHCVAHLEDYCEYFMAGLIFELLELLEPDSQFDDIAAKLKRLTDFKIFEVGLSWLQCLASDDVNYQLINDYAVWHTNY